MSFKNYFNDISNMINESDSGIQSRYNLFGYNVDEYIDGDTGPINFWTSDKLIEDTEYISLVLYNPLVIETIEYDMNDLYFNTRCVGYAIEHDYDSVIIEYDNIKYVITIDFDEDIQDINQYITEAGGKRSLKGKGLSKEKREELKQKQKERREARKKEARNTKRHKELKRPTSINRPKKAPEQGMRVDVMLANTGKLSPARVERAMKEVRKQPPKLTGVKDVNGVKYFRAEYNFKSINSKDRQLGYADVSQDKQYCNELFCTCADFFYRLYAPYVAAGLSTWNVPPKYKSRQYRNVGKTPDHKWTVDTNPFGKLFLCKHLWAFLAYYVAGDAGNLELTDEEIEDIIDKYFKDVNGVADDSADAENSTETAFTKAFGKLYVGQKGEKIKHYKSKEEADKDKTNRRQVYYQLPTKDKTNDNEEEVDNE